MITKKNPRRCAVGDCAVIVYQLTYRISGIGDDAQIEQSEPASDNSYRCQNREDQLCACRRHDLD